MASTTKVSKSRDVARATIMIAGIAKHYASTSSLMVDGASHTPAQLMASLQALVDMRKTVDDARAALMTRIETEKAQAPAARKLIAALVIVVKGSFGNSPDVLADFGVTPKKAPTPLTVEQKAAAAAKRSATRAARHTMGTKQRKGVKGQVTGISITTHTASPPAAPSPATSAPVTGTPAVGTPHGT
jgi:hypothetical protein